MNNNNLPKSHYEGFIEIDKVKIPCAVLYDENDKPIRVFNQRKALKILTNNEQGVISRYLKAKNLQDYVPEKYKNGNYQESIFPFIDLRGKESMGFVGTDLIDICNMYLQARKAGNVLNKNQNHLAERSEVIILAFAKVGVNALIDEATGYQDVRVKGALQQILNKFLLEDAKKYQVTYPLELYKQWFRLNGWEWKEQNAQKRPGVIGTWTNKYIYERIAPNILKELEKKNPKNEKGYREYKHFQFLTDEVGEPKLREFFGGLIALARATTSWRKYTQLVERAYPKIGDQLDLFNEDD